MAFAVESIIALQKRIDNQTRNQTVMFQPLNRFNKRLGITLKKCY